MFREKSSFPGELPVTGRETILDAINFAGGLSPQADHKGVVLYRQPPKGGPLAGLPIDIDQITMGDDLSTNYQLMPGDRLVVPRNANSKPDMRRNRGRASASSVRAAIGPVSLLRSSRRRDSDTPAEQPATRRDKPSTTISTLRRVEARLNDVEQKLDLILEALKPRTP